MRTRLARVLFTMLVLFQMTGVAQSSAIIGPDGKPLRINPGMSLKEAINELKPEHQSYVMGGDSGWVLQIHDNARQEQVLMSLWSDEFEDYTFSYAAKVRVINIFSPKYKTKEGVHVGMLLADAEKKLGKIKSIFSSEPAFEEYAVFTNMPAGISFRISGGILEEGKRETQRYSPDARITMMTVTD